MQPDKSYRETKEIDWYNYFKINLQFWLNFLFEICALHTLAKCDKTADIARKCYHLQH